MSVHLSVPSTYPSLKRLPSFYFPFCFSIGCCWRQKVYRSSKLTIPWPQLSHFLFFLFLAMIGSFIILFGRLATYLYPSFSVYFIGLFSILSLMAVSYFSVALVSLWQSIDGRLRISQQIRSVAHAFVQQTITTCGHIHRQAIRHVGYSTSWLICVSPPLHPHAFMPELLFHLLTTCEARGLISACDPQEAAQRVVKERMAATEFKYEKHERSLI